MTAPSPSPSLARFRDLCRFCDAPVVWAVTRRGVPMPVDPQPSDRGNILLQITGGQLRAGVLGRNQAAGARERGQKLHTHHRVNCTDQTKRGRRRRTSAAAQRRAEERRRVSECRLCDGDGYRWHPDGKAYGVLPLRCDHQPHREPPSPERTIR